MSRPGDTACALLGARQQIVEGLLRIATAVAGVIGGLVLLLQYFVHSAAFCWLAKRAARKESLGFVVVDNRGAEAHPLESQY